MNYQQLNEILDIFKDIPDAGRRDKAVQLMLQTASEDITLEKIIKLTAKEEKKADSEGFGTSGHIKFSRKEINSMPDYLKKLFTINDKIVTYRTTKDGYYQARFRRDGYNIEVAAKDFETMKRKFIDKLCEVEREKRNHDYPLFSEFIAEWLKIKKQTVKESTYKSYCNILNAHILPRLGNYNLNEITRKDIQDFLFEISDQGKMRTAHKIKLILSAVFDVAHEDYGLKTPMTKIVLSHYEVKKGNAFTKAEEKQIVDFCTENTQFAGNSALLILLYTGMRVGELKSLKFDGTYITCESEKTRKGYAKVIRKIPLSPMLKRVLHLIDFKQAIEVSCFTVRDALKRVFPGRHVHELRYTFITRAKECGVNPEVVMKWAGHEYDAAVKTSRVDRGYTDYSEEYLLQEINKIDYKL